MNTLDRTSASGALVLPLAAIRLKDLPRVGGKAAHLGEMLAAGLPVPAGFVVTTEAFDQFMQSLPEAGDWLKRLEHGGAEDAPASMRDQLSALALPAAVAAAITAALATEPGGAWAVRSSATVEDSPEASFAGQHDSWLNVRGTAAVLEAVKACWRSLFSERAIAYRQRKHVTPGRARMAVVVQRFVAADAAGVMFTRDPTGGGADTVLIEAAFGLGESVVQGRVTPDRLRVSRADFRVAGREAGMKSLRVVAAGQGVCEERLAREKATAPVLDDITAARLARLGLVAERVFPGPLDIEWGVCHGEIWLLQARAVTVWPGARVLNFEDRQVWTNANSGEVLPDVMTPMTWSLVQIFGQVLVESFFLRAGVKLKLEQLIGLVAGRMYFNFNTVCAVAHRLRGVKYDRSMEVLMGGHQDAWVALQRVKLSAADLPEIKLNRWKLGTYLLTMTWQLLSRSPRQYEAATVQIRQNDEELAGAQLAALSDEALLARLMPAAGSGNLEKWWPVDAIGFSVVFYVLLFGLCDRWFKTAGRNLANRLLAGAGVMDDVAAGHELWRLAEQAARMPEVRTVLLGGEPFVAVAARLKSSRDGLAFLEHWEAFMRQHGHHTRGEIEFYNPRWSECPDFVLGLVRGYVEAIQAGHAGPMARQAALAADRLAAEQECLARLAPWRRPVFRFVFRRARRAGQLRENLKSELVRWLACLRQFLLELGRRLVARGRLAQPDDIFFLELPELPLACQRETGNDWRGLVAGRRAEYERNVKVTPPPVVVGRFDAEAFMPEAVDGSVKVFHGLGLSTGKVTGRARVILRSDAAERVQPGEILVAPFTDPGWTPYFVAAAGIVMDLGGLLSHGSIVAREFGIPAVVNVGPATKIIRTGQWLEVDADRGVVRVLDAEPKGS